MKGWVSPEELLYPQVQEALTAWTRANRPRHEVVRVVGEQWSPRSHELRDALARNTVPFGFYAADSDEGRRLIARARRGRERLPAVILHDGSVLHDPTLVDVADALGVHTRPRPRSTIWRSSGRDRPGWRPRSTAPPKGCAPSSSSRGRSAARPERAR